MNSLNRSRKVFVVVKYGLISAGWGIFVIILVTSAKNNGDLNLDWAALGGPFLWETKNSGETKKLVLELESIRILQKFSKEEDPHPVENFQQSSFYCPTKFSKGVVF